MRAEDNSPLNGAVVAAMAGATALTLLLFRLKGESDTKSLSFYYGQTIANVASGFFIGGLKMQCRN